MYIAFTFYFQSCYSLDVCKSREVKQFVNISEYRVALLLTCQ